MKNKNLFPILAVGLALAALATTTNSAQAALITLQNPNFDSAAAPALTGWTKSGSGTDSGSFIPGASDTPPQSGTQTYIGTSLFGFGLVGQFIFQSDLIQVQADTTYTLSLWVAGRQEGLGYGGYVAQIGVGNFGTNTETPAADFRTLAVSNGAGTGLLNKPFELITFSFTTPSDLTNTTFINPTPGDPSAFDNSQGTSVADVTGQYLRIGVGMPLTLASGQLDGTQTFIDTVSFDATAVPEPSTWAFLGLGLVAIALLRKRSREA